MAAPFLSCGVTRLEMATSGERVSQNVSTSKRVPGQY